MKKISFHRLAFAIVAGLTIASCSQNFDVKTTNDETFIADENGTYHYTMELNCAKPVFDDNGTTRAVTYTDWDNGAIVYMRFRSGTSFIAGTATYNKSENTWDIATNSSLPISSVETTCELFYFHGAEGQTYSTVNMSERTACFYTTSATYKHPIQASISVNAILDRKTWRLRFRGTPGVNISLLGERNSIVYYNSFDCSTAQFKSDKKDVSLTVASDGYTPYIYGTFANSTGDNLITVHDGGSYCYEMALASSKLKVGESAYLNIPSEASYNGWTKISAIDDYTKDLIADPNLYVKQNQFMVLSGGFGCNWTAGSNTSYSYNRTILKSEVDEATDLELYNKIMKSTKTENIQNYSSWNDKLSPNTDYYLLTLAFNAEGKHTAIYKHPFRTASNLNQPLAKISNLKAETVNGVDKWTLTITLSNATTYYLIDDTRFEDDDDYYYAFCCYRWITEKQVTDTYSFEGDGINWNRGTDTQTTVLSWALTSGGDLSGEVSIARASATSNVRSKTRRNVPNTVIDINENKSRSIDYVTKVPKIRIVTCY